MSNREVVILSGARTAIGDYGGSLKDIPPSELGALVVREAVARAKVDPKDIGQCVIGNVIHTEPRDMYISRLAAVNGGLPVETGALTVNRLCGSGLQAIVSASQYILLGDTDAAVAGGAESMSRAAYMNTTQRWGARMGDTRMLDAMTGALSDPFEGIRRPAPVRSFRARIEKQGKLFDLRSGQTRIEPCRPRDPLGKRMVDRHPRPIPQHPHIRRRRLEIRRPEHGHQRVRPIGQELGRAGLVGGASGHDHHRTRRDLAGKQCLDRFLDLVAVRPHDDMTGFTEQRVRPRLVRQQGLIRPDRRPAQLDPLARLVEQADQQAGGVVNARFVRATEEEYPCRTCRPLGYGPEISLGGLHRLPASSGFTAWPSCPPAAVRWPGG